MKNILNREFNNTFPNKEKINVINVIKCTNCKENYIGASQEFYKKVSLHENNINISENRTVSKTTFSIQK